MRKVIISLLLSVALIGGCSQAEESQSQSDNVEQVQAVEAVEIVTSEEHEGKTLMEVVKAEHEVVETDGFISGINGLVADEDNKEFIAIYLNDEMAMVGANDLTLENGDVVKFKIETWE